MKRFIVLAALTALCAGFGMNVSAQDVILTKDMDIIKAYVREISDDTVSYTKASNPDGPLYKISTAKLLKISFENGTEDVFATPGEAESQQNNAAYQSVGVASSSPFTPQAAEKLAELDSNRGDVLLNGKKLSSAEMEVIMPYDLYASARKGQKMRNVGKGLMIPGAILTGFAIGFSIAADTVYDVRYSAEYGYVCHDSVVALACLSCASAVIGVPLLATGIPLYCVGQGKVRRAVNAYNEQFTKDYSFNVGSTRNGFGLYLNF